MYLEMTEAYLLIFLVGREGGGSSLYFHVFIFVEGLGCGFALYSFYLFYFVSVKARAKIPLFRTHFCRE